MKYNIVESKDKKKLLAETTDGMSYAVCSTFKVKKIHVDQRTNAKLIVFSYFDDQTNRNIEIKTDFNGLSRKNIGKLLNDNGILIGSEFHAAVSSYLEELAIFGKITDFKVDRAGFDENKEFFYTNEKIGPYTVETNVVQSTEFSEALKAQGSKQKYDEMLKKWVTNSEMQLALMLGLSAPVASYIKDKVDVGTLIISLTGTSSKGKTTSLNLINSLFSSPIVSSSNPFAKLSKATLLHLNENCKNIYGIPVTIDDLSANEKLNTQNLIMTLEQGFSKGHMLKDYSQGSTSGWDGAFILSSERKLIKDDALQGSVVRLLSFENVAWTQNAEQSIAIKDVVKENFGFYGELFVKELLKHEKDKVKEMIYEAKRSLEGKIGYKDDFADREMLKLSVILVATRISKSIFDGVLKIDYDGIEALLIESEKMKIYSRNSSESAKNKLLNFLRDNENKMINTYKSGIVTNPIGKLIESKGRKTYYVFKEVIDEFFDKISLAERKQAIIKKWITENFIIDNDKNRLTVRLMISGKNYLCYKICDKEMPH